MIDWERLGVPIMDLHDHLFCLTVGAYRTNPRVPILEIFPVDKIESVLKELPRTRMHQSDVAKEEFNRYDSIHKRTGCSSQNRGKPKRGNSEDDDIQDCRDKRDRYDT